MRTPATGAVAGPAPSTSYAAVPRTHPAHADRPVSGSKGDAWIVDLPADVPAGTAVLAFDTGLDGTTIVLGGMDGGPRRHPSHYDESHLAFYRKHAPVYVPFLWA